MEITPISRCCYRINAIVHRDYDRDVSTNIRVFDNRVEIVSFGGLPPNTTIETFLLGLSIPGNKNLADIFYRLELIEAFGSGIPKMTDIYRAYGQEVGFKTSPSGFMIVLPDLNFNKESKTARSEQTDPQEEFGSLVDQRAKSGLDYIQAKGPVSRMELEAVWGISRSTATMWLGRLVNAGVLLRIGHGRNTKYTIDE